MFVEFVIFTCCLSLFLAYAKYKSNQNLLVGFEGHKGLPLLGNVADFFSRGDVLQSKYLSIHQFQNFNKILHFKHVLDCQT